MTDQELKDLVASLAVSQAQTDEQMRQTDEQMRQTDMQLEKLRISQAQTDEQMRQTDEQMRQTDEKIKKIGVLTGNISNNQGDVTEEFFYNSLAHKPSLAGIDYDFVEPNAHRRKDNVEDEYDILLVNGKDIAIIETKYKAHTSDIEKLIDFFHNPKQV